MHNMNTRSFLGVGALAGILAYLFIPVSMKLVKLNQQNESLEAEIQQLSAKNQLLQHELHLLQNDPIYIENVARQTFNKTKEGEIIYQIVPAEDAASPDGATAPRPPAQKTP